MEGFKVIIAADASQGINAVAKFNAELSKTNAAGAGVSAAVTKVNTSLNSIRPASNSAGLALQNLGRIAQDAPFGFIGISNNINPLLESFQRLRATSGSTGGALKALASSLMGAGGIGLAVSVASSLLVVFGDRLFKTKQTATDAANAMKSLADITKEVISAAAEESTKITLLVDRLREGNLSRKETIGIIEELKKIAPDYFGKLDAEKTKINEVVLAYNNYNKALVKNIEAQIHIKELTERTTQRLALQEASPQANTALQKQLEGGKSLVDVLAETAKKRLDLLKLTSDQSRAAGTSSQQLRKEAKELSEFNAVMDIGNAMLQENFVLQKINSVPPGKLGVGPAAEKDNDLLALRIKQLEDLRTQVGLLHSEKFELRDLKVEIAVRDAVKNGLNVGQVQRMIDEIMKTEPVKLKVGLAIDTSVTSITEFGTQIRKINTSLATLGGSLEGGPAASITRTFDVALDKAEQLATFISSTLQPVFSAVFETIANGGTNALQAFGNALKALVAKLVSAAITAAIFAAIMTIATGGASGVFQGQFLKAFNLMSGLPKFAEGGIVQGPMNAIIGERGPEAVIPLRDLNKVLGSIGGAGSREIFIAENRIDGNDIVTIYRRASNRYGGTFS